MFNAELHCGGNDRQRIGTRLAPCTVLALLLIGLLMGCTSPRAKITQVPVQPEVIKSSVKYEKVYILAPGDQLEVVVRGVPEASRTVEIRSDGDISLPIIQDVRAAGLTPPELAQELTKKFSTTLINPQVNIIPTKIRQPMIYVVGEVNRPVPIPFRDAPTAGQAIADAGGFARSAATHDVAIIRLGDDGYLRAIVVTTNDKGQPGPYMALRATLLEADDVVFVPESGRSQISRFLDDFVNRPLLGVAAATGVYANIKFITQ